MSTARQFFIVDLDQPRREPRRRFGFGRHRRDRLADIAHLALGDGVLVLDEGAHAMPFAEILAGDDGVHAGHRQRFAEIVALDAGMGVRAAEQGAVQHARAIEIGDVLRAALDLLAHLDARQIGADGAKRRGHDAASIAARQTASTILR